MFRALPVLAALMATTAAVPAHADYFAWADQKSGVSLSFPDTWKMVNNQQPNDIITVALPSGDDRAMCRVRVDKDERYAVFPNQYDSDVQKISYSQPFWDQYTASFDHVKVHEFREVTGLGKGFGSMELASYSTAPGEVPEYRTGVMFVSFYHNQAYVADCSATAQSYQKYHPQFMDFVKSIDFKKSVHELTVGNYRDFLFEWGEIEVKFPNAVSASTY